MSHQLYGSFIFLWGHRLFPLNCLATKFELTFVASGSFIWIYDVFSGRGRDDDVVLYEIYPGATRATFRISHFEHRISTLSSRRSKKGVFNGIHFISPRLMLVSAFHSPSTRATESRFYYWSERVLGRKRLSSSWWRKSRSTGFGKMFHGQQSNLLLPFVSFF